MIQARRELGGAGASADSAVAFGGNPNLTCTEEYDGSSWTAGGNMITGRQFVAGNGTQELALAIGGQSPSIVGCTEEYTKPLVYRNFIQEFKTI